MTTCPEKPKRPYHLIDPQSPFTDFELQFLDIFFEGKTTPEKAVFTAGCRDLSARQRHNIGQKIIKKYEEKAGKASNIFRDLGFGEARIAQIVKHLGEKGKAEAVRLRACELAMRAMGMLEQIEQSNQGITIIFEASSQASQPAALALPAQDAEQEQPATPALPVRVLQITR